MTCCKGKYNPFSAWILKKITLYALSGLTKTGKICLLVQRDVMITFWVSFCYIFLVMRMNNLINYWWGEYHSSKCRCQHIVHRGNLWLIGSSWRFCLLLANWLILLWILHAIFWQLSRLFWLWNLDLSALSGVVVQHCTFWYKTAYHECWKDIFQLGLAQVVEECHSPHTG